MQYMQRRYRGAVHRMLEMREEPSFIKSVRVSRGMPGQRLSFTPPSHNDPGKPANRADPDGGPPEVVTVQLDRPVPSDLDLRGSQTRHIPRPAGTPRQDRSDDPQPGPEAFSRDAEQVQHCLGNI